MIPVLDLTAEINEIRNDVDKAIKRVVDNAQFIMGEEVKQFEQEVAAYLGVKHAIGVNSGTDALVIGLRAAGIGSGDEVITSPFSFFATAESISMTGAKPVFVDVDARTCNIDVELIEEAITPNTKAIMPVHLYGRPAQMSRIMELAQKHDLKVIEDCAQSFGATYAGRCKHCNGSCGDEMREAISGKKTGVIGDVGAYSFFPSKNLGGFGDGGLVVTNDDAMAEQMRMMRVHGARKKYHNEILGYNSRLDTIQAAVLRTKLPHIDRWNKGRLAAAGIYNMLLEQKKLSPEWVETPTEVSGYVFHQYTIRLNTEKIGKSREQVQKELKEKGVGSMVYYPVPQDKLPVYAKDYTPKPVSAALAEEVLSLPIWPLITMQTQDKVVEALAAVLRA
jgi:dTDP-4-amino-4,6-dideoxygalactose transaminase